MKNKRETEKIEGLRKAWEKDSTRHPRLKLSLLRMYITQAFYGYLEEMTHCFRTAKKFMRLNKRLKRIQNVRR